MKIYVCGFFFSPTREHVLLIRKNRPAWQQGRLNGVGGKLEPGETVHQAISREFHEEAGLRITTWREGIILTGTPTPDDPAGWQGHFFSSVAESEEQFRACRSQTDELLEVHPITRLPRPGPAEKGVIPNLHWIIPLPLDDEATHFRKYTIQVAPK